MKGKALYLALGGLALAGLFLAHPALAYSLIGGSLPLDYRGFRVYNNFQDSTANDNRTAEANYPGALGAELSCWKAAMEWGSRPHMDGKGDPLQSNIGDGGGNFDFFYLGRATSYSNPRVGDNMIFAVTDLGSGVLGATFSYQNGNPPGWYMAISERYTWDDGPGNHSLLDLQGIVTHELGHSLRLGHSSNQSATMYYAAQNRGLPARSIHTDDGNGVKAIYGTRSSTKPEITGTGGAYAPGQVMTISGRNFATTGNEVWFTSGGSPSPVKVTGVSSTAGGTTLSFTIPLSARVGNVAVKIPGSSAWCLSNPWAYDPTIVTNPPQLTGISPATVANIQGGVVTLAGKYLAGVTRVDVGALQYGSGSFTIVSDSQIKFNAPDPPVTLGVVKVTATNPSGTSNAVNLTITGSSSPRLEAPTISGSYAVDQIRMASQANFAGLLFWSYSETPSVVPGLVNLGIGSNFTKLFILIPVTFDKAGRAGTQITIPYGLAGATYLLQLVAVDPQNPGKLPVPASNYTKTKLIF